MKSQLTMFSGICRYEFRMQIRRRALWVAMIITMLLLERFQHQELMTTLIDISSSTALLPKMAGWADFINRLLPIVVGIFIADRLPRDRTTKVDELLATTPAHVGTRLAGKYFGSTCATLTPVFLFYCLGVGVILFRTQHVEVLLYALLTFGAIVLPGMLLVTAFSLACPLVIWWPAYCFLFTGYWFWGNLLSTRQHIPTISETILTPAGGYMSKGFFGVPAFQIWYVPATTLQAVASLLLLLGLALFMLIITWGFLQWKEMRA